MKCEICLRDHEQPGYLQSRTEIFCPTAGFNCVDCNRFVNYINSGDEKYDKQPTADNLCSECRRHRRFYVLLNESQVAS